VPGVRNRLWLVPGVQHGFVYDLEMYLGYGFGLWIVWKGVWSTVWKGTPCTNWDCGWFGKVPGEWFG
jgi:hypothetical protein